MAIAFHYPADLQAEIEAKAKACGLPVSEVYAHLNYKLETIEIKPRMARRVPLDESAFFQMTAARWVEPIGIGMSPTLGEVARKVIADYDSDLLNVPNGNQHLAWAGYLQKHWSWEKAGTDFMFGDGMHRRVALSVLLLLGRTRLRKGMYYVPVEVMNDHTTIRLKDTDDETKIRWIRQILSTLHS